MDKLYGLALCAGVGGLERGIKKVLGKRYGVVTYVERDVFAASELVKAMQNKTLDQAPIWDDVFTLARSKIGNRVDFISAGYPCQPFSNAARGRNNTPDLWPEIRRIINEWKPTWVFLENVKRKDDLQEIGYETNVATVCASHVGAPHKRTRTFTLGRHTNYQGKSDLSVYAKMDWVQEFCARAEGTWTEPSADVRMVDGTQVDKLRVLGNAVVPLQAELALRLLLEDFYV